MARITDTDKDELRNAVYDIVKAIPVGMVLSYGEIARLAGFPGYHRMVGSILHGVPDELGLPCHRVLNSQGRLVPGWSEHHELLKTEGIILKSNGCVDMKRFGWNPMGILDE